LGALLKKLEMAATVEAAMKEGATRNNIDADRFLQELARI
jgi:hypothetical protein